MLNVEMGTPFTPEGAQALCELYRIVLSQKKEEKQDAE